LEKKVKNVSANQRPGLPMLDI